MHLGLIGNGNIAAGLIAGVAGSRVSQITILVRTGSNNSKPDRTENNATDLPIRYVTSPLTMIEAHPDLIVECAAHSAVASYGPAILSAGIDMVIASIGAFADEKIQNQIRSAATEGEAQVILPSGAIGGLDLLRAITRTNKADVTYRGIKPPQAWRGSPAEEAVDLDHLDKPVTFFSGTGRQAALAYPKNANVVAALALAGAGFDTMKVKLIADPTARSNQHSYKVASKFCHYSMTIEATGSSGNARTSVTTILSILQEISTYRARPQ